MEDESAYYNPDALGGVQTRHDLSWNWSDGLAMPNISGKMFEDNAIMLYSASGSNSLVEFLISNTPRLKSGPLRHGSHSTTVFIPSNLLWTHTIGPSVESLRRTSISKKPNWNTHRYWNIPSNLNKRCARNLSRSLLYWQYSARKLHFELSKDNSGTQSLNPLCPLFAQHSYDQRQRTWMASFSMLHDKHDSSPSSQSQTVVAISISPFARRS